MSPDVLLGMFPLAQPWHVMQERLSWLALHSQGIGQLSISCPKQSRYPLQSSTSKSRLPYG